MARAWDNTLELMERGVAKVVEGSEVEMLTRQGWRIAKVLPESFATSVPESIPLVCAGQSYPTQASGTRAISVSTTRFLMFEDERSQLAKMAQLAAVHAVTHGETVRALEQAKRELKDSVAAHAKAQEVAERHGADIIRERGEKFEAKKQRDLMERDIAKIRSAVGELKMKEILATP